MARLEGESIYRRVSIRMHADAKVRRLSRPEPCGYSLWLELLAGEQTDVVPGLFRIGEAAFAEQLGWPLKGFRDAWKEIVDAGLPVKADWTARLVWVRNALRHNMPASPNVVRKWKDCWRDRLPDCALKEEAKAFIEASLKAFSEPYAKAFEEVYTKPSAVSVAKPSLKASPNQEAVISNQENVVRSKSGESEGREFTACESVDNLALSALSESDKAQVQRLLSQGKATEATALLASLKRSELHNKAQRDEVAS